MKKLVSISLALLICFSLLIASERQAFAYVDPSTGFLALQSAASVVAASAYFLRKRLLSLFGRDKVQDEVVVNSKTGNPVKAA